MVVSETAIEVSTLYDKSGLPGPLKDHQLSALAYLEGKQRAILADDPGMGKTAVGLAWVAHLLEEDPTRRAVIVTDSSLVRQMRGEVERLLPSLSVLDCTESRIRNQSPKQTLLLARQYPKGPDVFVTSYDTLAARIENDYSRRPCDVLILDEASAIKGSGVQHDAVRVMAKKASHVLAITATPLENSPMDAHAILTAMGITVPVEFATEWVLWREGFQPSFGPAVEPAPIGPNPETIDQLRAYVSEFLLRRTAPDVALPLPELVRTTKWVPLTANQQRAYDTASQRYSHRKRHAELERICSYHGSESAKADEAIRLIESRPNDRKVIVYGWNPGHLQLAGERLTAKGIGWCSIDGSTAKVDRAAATTRFREDPLVRVLLGSSVLERGHDGLQVASLLISLGSSDNPGREVQREGRIVRLGSPHAKVEHITVYSATEHDGNKSARVSGKRDGNESVLGGLGTEDDDDALAAAYEAWLADQAGEQ